MQAVCIRAFFQAIVKNVSREKSIGARTRAVKLIMNW